ncbi:hypothetical protein NS226_07230 [Aureimonas ureilytica]|uniref:Uncharacterized protein n=2 Tax=Aureimonas ureilytica TaxID=401562 RepID=A0A175R9T6_9HYPH|nr:hypothetical protein NS226_07230 [Aureimonas ureilytica]
MEEPICSALGRIKVVCRLADDIEVRQDEANGEAVRLPADELDPFLFMIEEARRAVSALSELYQSTWAAEAASEVNALEQARAAKLTGDLEHEELRALICQHRAAAIAYDAAAANAGELDAPPEAAELLDIKAVQWKEASAALLSWRPSTCAGNADRIRYLFHDENGIWKDCRPTEDELTMLFASMAEVGHGG